MVDPTRRDVIAAAAAAGMDLAPYVRRSQPVSAEAHHPSTQHPDVDLIELGAFFFAALARRDQHDSDADDALGRCRHIDIPGALVVREGDEGVRGFRELTKFKIGGEWQEAFEGGLADLNRYAQRYAAVGDAFGIDQKFFSDAARERTREIASAHKLWTAEIARAEAECGFTVLHEAAGRETKAMAELRLRIASQPAATTDGLALKARVACQGLSPDPKWVESALLPGLLHNPDPNAGWSADDPLLVSLVMDAMKIGAAQPVRLP